MTKEDIIQLAREAGFLITDGIVTGGVTDIERFAYLVAGAERNACAKIASNRYLDDEDPKLKAGYDFACRRIALDIQSR